MRNTLFFWAPALFAVGIVSAFPGCGSSSNNNTGKDAGPTADSSADTGENEAGDDGSTGDANQQSDSPTTGDTGMTCTVAHAPKGMQLVKASNVSVQGVTSDGQIIYYDGNAQTLNAIPVAVAGGTPAKIGSWDKSQQVVLTSNKVALYWNGTGTQTTNVHGALSVWTAAGGQQALGTQSFFSSVGGGFVDVSADGSLVLYTDNATSSSADIYVAGSDGSNKTKLVSNVSLGANCRPIVRFAGNTAVVGYCTSQPDAGTTLTANVEAYSAAPTWQTKQTFAAGDGFYSFSIGAIPAGDGGVSGYNVGYLTSAGEYVEALGGTVPTLIDAKGAGGGVFMHNGTDIIYFETDSSVWRSPIGTPAPVELATGPYAGSLALSTDDKWLELYLNVDSTTQFTTDMYLVSTTPAAADAGNAPFTLTSSTKGANFGEAFTADNSHVLFFPDVMMSGSAGYVGSYETYPLPPTGMATVIAPNVWEEFATTGAKTLYNDKYLSNAGFAGAADIESIDLSSPAAMPTTLVSQADANFFLTADKQTIVYSWSSCPGAQDGVYALPAP